MPFATSLASTSELLAGRYGLTQRIRAASDGEVWHGTDAVLGRPVTVELLRIDVPEGRELLARFREKARHAGSVNHAGIARIYDYDEACFPHPPYLVMELTDGPSLAEVIAGSAPAEPSRVMDIVAQAAAALHAVHRAGLVHRAVKPENILTTRDGQVKLACLGSSPVTGLPGTPASDLYALGVVARDCLAASSGAIPAEVTALISEITDADPARRPNAAAVASRAAQLRDRMSADVLAQADELADVLTLTMPAETLARPVPVNGPKWTWRQGLLPSLAIPVVVLAGMFLGLWHHAPAHRAPAAATMVEVNAAVLKGRPVDAVRTELRHEGLAVRIQWRPTYQVPAGRVVSVAPGGRMPSGTLVTVTGASRPAAVSHSPAAPVPSRRSARAHREARAPAARPTAAHSTAPASSPTPARSPTPAGTPSPAGSSSSPPTGTPTSTESSPGDLG